MKAKKSDWYKYGWSLDIKNQSWTEDTKNQVDFISRTLKLKGHERILDLACRYGRHSISLAKRGFFGCWCGYYKKDDQPTYGKEIGVILLTVVA